MSSSKKSLYLTIIISALGYFVDIYDLLLFGIVRTPSLRDIGVSESDLLPVGVHLLNMQMAGMLIGGILWGVLGDKKGRKSVLFGSILLYSLANIANVLVTNVFWYAILRFVAGIGLAGELGAAITLVAESMPKDKRGYGTALVSAIGILGAVVASLIGDYFNWKIAYLVGGFMGLSLLALRAGLLESSLFDQIKNSHIKKGSFIKLILNRKLFIKYLCCISIGVPIWFIIGILVTFAPELSQEHDIIGVTGSRSILWAYLGLSLGDISSGLISQWLKSRKKAVFLFLSITTLTVCLYVFMNNLTINQFYILCFTLGFGGGYWAVFVTIASEQFGTNIRATVTTTVPNFVRGSVIPLTLSFSYFKAKMDLLSAAFCVGIISLLIAFIALRYLKDTFHKDLNYLETL